MFFGQKSVWTGHSAVTPLSVGLKNCGLVFIDYLVQYKKYQEHVICSFYIHVTQQF